MYKFLDLCAGIGGAHTAFNNLGCECVGFSEICTHTSNAYKALHGTHYINFNDVTQINTEELPPYDILVAGFPCQSFSTLGNRKGFISTQGCVIFSIIKILKENKPRCFLLENVPGFTFLNKGACFKLVIKMLEKAGYNVFYKQLFSNRFGVSQARKRVYIVGFRKELNVDFFEYPTGSEPEDNIEEFLTSCDEKMVLSGKTFETFTRGFYKKRRPSCKETIESLREKDFSVISLSHMRAGVFFRVVPTVTGDYGLFYTKDGKFRCFSGTERLALQGFGKKYIETLVGLYPNTKIRTMSGNAMTVPVIEAIGKEILGVLDKK